MPKNGWRSSPSVFAYVRSAVPIHPVPVKAHHSHDAGGTITALRSEAILPWSLSQ